VSTARLVIGAVPAHCRAPTALLDTARAVGAKDLKDYLEVTGYGAVARWVYSQALSSSGWERSDLVTITEFRQVHAEAIGLVWEVAPDPVARPQEGPGSFRRHDIHPFIDGNGRVGRLILNVVLVRLGWPPAIIVKRQRDRYLDALGRADSGDPGPLAELIARAVLENLERLVVPNIAGPARVVPLQSLAGPDLSYGAL
jgi:hypothetical protein